MYFPLENKVFQRPCCRVLLPSWYFATTVVNYYDNSILSMARSLGTTDLSAVVFLALRRVLWLWVRGLRDLAQA